MTGTTAFNCCFGVPDPLNARQHTTIAITFAAPEVRIARKILYCDELFPNASWSCLSPMDSVMAGQGWTCIYAKEQEACEYYATGAYRLVYVATSGCFEAKQPGGPGCSDCTDPCPIPAGKSNILCNWNGVDLGALNSKWQPPSSVSVTRIQ